MLELLLCAADGIVVGVFASVFLQRIFGDKAIGRAAKVLGGLLIGAGYSLLCLYIGYGEHDLSMELSLGILFAPIAAVIIIKFILYINGK